MANLLSSPVPLMFFTLTVGTASAAAQDSEIPDWAKALLGLLSVTILLVLLLLGVFVALYCLLKKMKEQQLLRLPSKYRGEQSNQQPQGDHQESDLYADVTAIGLANEGQMQLQKQHRPVSHPESEGLQSNEQPENDPQNRDSYIYVDEYSFGNEEKIQPRKLKEPKSPPISKSLQSNTQPGDVYEVLPHVNNFYNDEDELYAQN